MRAAEPQGEVAAALRWAHAESKRVNRHFTRRAACENGNQTPHAVLFDPQNVPAFDGEARIRRLSPEIYGAFLKDAAKKSGTSQPFSPAGGTTFKDMGDPRVDEPTTAACSPERWSWGLDPDEDHRNLVERNGGRRMDRSVTRRRRARGP